MKLGILELCIAAIMVGPAAAQQPPDDVIRRIAVTAANGSSSSLPVQEDNVRQFIASNGAWFENYRARYGRPSPESSLPKRWDGENVIGPTLGPYYLHQEGGDFGVGKACPEPGPTLNAFCALAHLSAFLSRHLDEDRGAFLRQADIFTSSKDGRIEWSTDVPARGLKAPWISALTQSVAISVLLRAHELTGDPTYRKAASRAFGWLKKPLAEGGLASGGWLEEYPNQSAPSHVLNGHIWALLGVWDYYRITHDPAARRLFESGINVIKRNMSWYDNGFWLVYDHSNRADFILGTYMQLMIEQARTLYAITNDSFFRRAAVRWRSYQDNDDLFVAMVSRELKVVSCTGNAIWYVGGSFPPTSYVSVWDAGQRRECVIERGDAPDPCKPGSVCTLRSESYSRDGDTYFFKAGASAP